MIDDDIRVGRVADILVANPDRRFHRTDLVDALSTAGTQLSLRSITRVWPGIEERVGRSNLFAIRPTGRLRYGVAACSDPLPAVLSLTYRERVDITRFNKDLSGLMLQHLAGSEDQEVAEWARLKIQRTRTFLTSAERDGISVWQLEMRALDAYRRLGWAHFRTDRTYARDEQVQTARTA